MYVCIYPCMISIFSATTDGFECNCLHYNSRTSSFTREGLMLLQIVIPMKKKRGLTLLFIHVFFCEFILIHFYRFQLPNPTEKVCITMLLFCQFALLTNATALIYEISSQPHKYYQLNKRAHSYFTKY